MCISMVTSLYGSQSLSLNVGAFALRLLWTKCEDVITIRDCPNNEANNEGSCGVRDARSAKWLNLYEVRRNTIHKDGSKNLHVCI